jgi:Flp pilus assembly protein TadG
VLQKLQREKGSRRRDDEGGAELVEFAIVVVLLVTLLYGIISFGLVFAVKNGANSAADDAARAALSAYNYDVTSGNPANANGDAQTAATAAVNRDLSWLGSTSCSSATPTSSAPKQCKGVIGTSTSGPTFTETVTYDYSGAPLVPLLPGLNIGLLD